jgi:hypothetical protein
MMRPQQTTHHKCSSHVLPTHGSSQRDDVCAMRRAASCVRTELELVASSVTLLVLLACATN